MLTLFSFKPPNPEVFNISTHFSVFWYNFLLHGHILFIVRICSSTLEYVLVSCCCCNKYYKLSDLKQPKLILLQFWKPESKISFTKDKMSAGLVPSPGSMGRIHSLPFSASHGRLCSLPCDPFLHLQSI